MLYKFVEAYTSIHSSIRDTGQELHRLYPLNRGNWTQLILNIQIAALNF